MRWPWLMALPVWLCACYASHELTPAPEAGVDAATDARVDTGTDAGTDAACTPGPPRCCAYGMTRCRTDADCVDPRYPACGPVGPGMACMTDVSCGFVCASPDTPIATPGGERPIAELCVGDLVYSVDDGRVRIVPIERIVRTPTARHAVVRVVLDSGRVLEISPGHPTADGRAFADLDVGDALGEARVESVETVPYLHDATYDVLPASSSGTYFAAGALIGSTLASQRD